jgi:type IV secretory pathway TrbD component
VLDGDRVVVGADAVILLGILAAIVIAALLVWAVSSLAEDDQALVAWVKGEKEK